MVNHSGSDSWIFFVGMQAYGCNLIVHTNSAVIFFVVRVGGAYDGIKQMGVLHGSCQEHNGAMNKLDLLPTMTVSGTPV